MGKLHHFLTFTQSRFSPEVKEKKQRQETLETD